MTGISFRCFAFSGLDLTDVLRRIRRDIAENFWEEGLPGSQKTASLAQA
jgi:hypothetical protein